MKATRVAIMGLGRIGAGYSNSRSVSQSHLAAALRVSGIKVSALIDPDASRLSEAGRHVPGAMKLHDLSELPGGVADVLIDATAGTERAAVVHRAAASGIRVVILEKPMATNVSSALAVLDASNNTGVTVRINFHRRFDSRHLAMKAEMTRRPTAVLAAYGKGILNYGSHLIDLMIDWMGTIDAARSDGSWTDDADPTLNFEVSFKDGRKGAIFGIRESDWDVFDATFLGPFGKIGIGNGGAELALFRPVNDLVYPGYVHLRRDELVSTSAAVDGLSELYSALHEHLNNSVPLPGATAADGLAGIAVIDAVRRSALGGGTWQTTALAA